MLDCPSDRIDGTLTITVDAVGTDGQAEGSLTLTMKQKAPQLSADAVKCVVAAMTLEEKACLVAGTQNKSRPDVSGTTYAIPRLGIPSIVVNDGPAGVRYGTSIWYPSEINVASSWDVFLARDIGVSMAEDSLAKDIDIILAPGMNIQKNILCGRNFEYLSEDPILTALMAGAYTDGIQSKGVGVAIKHFVANNQEVNRGTVSSTVTERALREIYLKAFGMVVQSSDPYTVMSSYNKLNGRLTVNGLKVCGKGDPPKENPFAKRSAFTIQVIQY
jgi:beta-glucosidase